LGNFIFSPPPTRFLFSFAFETFPTHPPTTPHCPPPTYSPIYLIQNRLFPIYLLPPYKFKMCYFHPHPLTGPSTVFDAPSSSLINSTPSPKVNTVEGEGVGVRSLARNILKVEGRVGALGWD
jgi:hypothetical protein